jgi:hypothetical protein
MERVVIGNYEIQAALTQTRMLKITGVVYDIDTAADLSIKVDMAQDELDRQMIRSDVLNKAAEISKRHENIKRMREHCDGLIKKRESGKITSQEKLQLQNFDVSLKNELDSIESLAAAIAEGKKKLGLAA